MQSIAVKASSIIVTLILMVAGVVTAIAYTNYSQQTRVNAQENILIDFGTVFPGMAVGEPFAVGLTDLAADTGVDYTLTLVFSGDTGLTDIRPLLLVQKNGSEIDTELDGLADGRIGDYDAAGSLANSGDLSDTWLATFFVPDVDYTGPVDYGGQIQINFIEPN